MKLRHALIAVAVVALSHASAKAEGIQIPAAPSVEEAVTPAPALYQTGCYVAGSVGVSVADVSVKGVSFADESATYGVGAGCDLVTGSLLVGALANANFSDSSEAAYQIGARAGLLISPHTLVYATGGWSLADFSQDFDGWFAGAGLEILINRHLFIGVEYTADLYDAEGGVEPKTHNVKGRLGWRF